MYFLRLCSLIAAFFCTILSYSIEPTIYKTCLEYPETKQQTPSTCFSNFENLYFDSDLKLFFSIGGEEIRSPLNTAEERGYSWKQYPSKYGLRFAPKKNLSIPGTTIIICEKNNIPNMVAHFFHLLEHLLGIWNFGGEEQRDEVSLFLIAGNGRKMTENWKGQNELTYHLIKALFPKAEVKIWEEFVEETPNDIVRFEKAITSDRSMEVFKTEPYYTERMLGGYFQQLKKEALDKLVAHVHEYCQVQKIEKNKLVVTYIPRFSFRWVAPDCERELIHRLESLPNVEVHLVDFAAIPFCEQINIVANTDVLLGAHGNGFSHTLFLRKGATIIELYPKNSFRVEYRIFAKARDVNYFGWMDSIGWIDDQSAEKMGCFGRVGCMTCPDEYEINVNVDAIMDVIQNCAKSLSIN